jgi:anti-anti-sigma factor
MSAACAPLAGLRAEQHASAVIRDRMCELSVVNVGSRVSWLHAAGELDASAAEPLARMLEEQCAAGFRFARLDLTEVGFLDPAVLAVLVDAHSRFLVAGGTLVLTGVGPPMARLLRRAGLDQTLFTITRATDPPPAHTTRGMTYARAPSEEAADQSSTSAAARAVIDQAVGVVMGRGCCSVMEATEGLRLVSRATNRTLREVAQSILDEASITRSHTPRAKRPRPRGQPSAARRNAERSAVMARRLETISSRGH